MVPRPRALHIGTSTGTTRIIPVHTIGEDLSWNHGAHDIRFGGVSALISNQSLNYQPNSFSNASSNPSWLTGSGSDLTPASLGVSSGDLRSSYEYAIAARPRLGIAKARRTITILINGTLIAAGSSDQPQFRQSRRRDLYSRYLESHAQLHRDGRHSPFASSLQFTKPTGSRRPPIFLSRLAGRTREFRRHRAFRSRTRGLIEFIPASQGKPMYPVP